MTCRIFYTDMLIYTIEIIIKENKKQLMATYHTHTHTNIHTIQLPFDTSVQSKYYAFFTIFIDLKNNHLVHPFLCQYNQSAVKCQPIFLCSWPLSTHNLATAVVHRGGPSSSRSVEVMSLAQPRRRLPGPALTSPTLSTLLLRVTLPLSSSLHQVTIHTNTTATTTTTWLSLTFFFVRACVYLCTYL